MYTKKVWAQGDIVTESALNNIESGIPNLPEPEIDKRVQVIANWDSMRQVTPIPSQTVTVASGEYEADLSNVDYELFAGLVGGDLDATLTINGTDYENICPEWGGYSCDDGTNVYGVSVKSSTIIGFFVQDLSSNPVPGTYTVSLSAEVPTTYWGIEQGETTPEEQPER